MDMTASREVHRESPLPLHRQIRNIVRADIRSGVLKTGDVTSEQELAAEFGVSRITIRHALARLAREGLVVRVPGKGTFVADQRKLEPQSALTSFSENMLALGKIPSHKTLHVAETVVHSDLVRLLQLEAGDPVLTIERLLLADDVPMALMTAHLPLWVYGQHRQLFSMAELDRTSLYELLENKLGIDLWLATETVEAQRAGADARLLDISPDDLLLAVQRCTANPGGQSVELTHIRYRADLYRYQAQLYRHGTLPIQPSGQLDLENP